jgi:hypothetical protein
LTSLTTFWIGAFIGRLGDKMGPKTRLWLFLGTMIQALFTMGAAIALWQSGAASVTDSRLDPAWTTPLTYLVIAFLSASLGLQGIMGKRVNTQFATTGKHSSPHAPLWNISLIHSFLLSLSLLSFSRLGEFPLVHMTETG